MVQGFLGCTTRVYYARIVMGQYRVIVTSNPPESNFDRLKIHFQSSSFVLNVGGLYKVLLHFPLL